MSLTPEQVVRAVARTCRGPLNPEYARLRDVALAHGDIGVAQQLDEAGRQPCGADFNDIVLSNPLDGKEYNYLCPRCGVEGHYRAPLFPEEAAS